MTKERIQVLFVKFFRHQVFEKCVHFPSLHNMKTKTCTHTSQGKISQLHGLRLCNMHLCELLVCLAGVALIQWTHAVAQVNNETGVRLLSRCH